MQKDVEKNETWLNSIDFKPQFTPRRTPQTKKVRNALA